MKTLRNEEITAEKIMLVDEDGSMIGQVSLQEGLRRAESKGIDLVQVQDKDVPVCKLLDLSKEVYRKKKAGKKSQKSHQKKMKEVKIGLATATHDLQTKTSQMSKFLSKGHQVRFTMRLRGRERSINPEFIEEKIDTVLKMIEAPYTQEGNMKKGMNFWSATLSPAKNNGSGHTK